MDKFRLCAFADEAGADINEQTKALKENGISLLKSAGSGTKISRSSPLHRLWN